MENDSQWQSELSPAIDLARQSGKGVLLQFHRDECSGCKKMYTLAYRDPEVQQELFSWFVPVRQDILKDRAVRSKYSAVWTPSFYFLDARGNAQYFQNGYFNPVDFRVLLRLGKAALDLPRGKYFDVIDLMDNGLEHFPDNPRAATMLFLRGMAEYLLGKEKSAFRSTMTEILELYPQSQEARMWPWPDNP
jgi:thioredoxin-related protein